MPNISLDLLDDHLSNANRMKDALFLKLVGHIKESKNYPPLIVRPHPSLHGRYQILDGHHRAKALRQLGYSQVHCDVWDVDDSQTDMLLLTLNRLCGDDDPYKRGEILKRLTQSLDIDALSKKLADDSDRIRSLIDATKPPPQPLEPEDVANMPHAVVFFLSASQRNCLFKKLKPFAKNRSDALIVLLELDTTCPLNDKTGSV